jgi:hypothetical protein
VGEAAAIAQALSRSLGELVNVSASVKFVVHWCRLSPH